jgi:hypothetical protein
MSTLDTVLYYWPGPHPVGKPSFKACKCKHQWILQDEVACAYTAWETVEIDWYGGQRKILWVFSHASLWYTLGLPPLTSALCWSVIPRANSVLAEPIKFEAEQPTR